jgi:hypothetical protein
MSRSCAYVRPREKVTDPSRPPRAPSTDALSPTPYYPFAAGRLLLNVARRRRLGGVRLLLLRLALPRLAAGRVARPGRRGRSRSVRLLVVVAGVRRLGVLLNRGAYQRGCCGRAEEGRKGGRTPA